MASYTSPARSSTPSVHIGKFSFDFHRGIPSFSEVEDETDQKVKKVGPDIILLLDKSQSAKENAVAWCKVFSIDEKKFIPLQICKIEAKEDDGAEQYVIERGSKHIGFIKTSKNAAFLFIQYIENLQPEEYKYVGTALLQFAFTLSHRTHLGGRVQGEVTDDTILFFLKSGGTEGCYLKNEKNPNAIQCYLPGVTIPKKTREQEHTRWISWIEG